MRSAPFLVLAAGCVLLGGCSGSQPAGGGSVAMHDMEVVDGTANDSTADLDNAASDIALPPMPGTDSPRSAGAVQGNAAGNASLPAAATGKTGSNSSAPD